IKELLDLPILYLSQYIIENKSEYYKHLQEVRDTGDWSPWVLFMLKGVEQTAENSISLVSDIGSLMRKQKKILKEVLGRSYRHELLNNLFRH
ncbi:MAG: Fic family protein, partial [Rikenellaceae bacterium]